MTVEDVIISTAAMTMTVLVIGLIVYFLVQRTKLRAGSGGDYQRLAEEAVRGQRLLLDETRRMNESLKEIERLLREVG